MTVALISFCPTYWNLVSSEPLTLDSLRYYYYYYYASILFSAFHLNYEFLLTLVPYLTFTQNGISHLLSLFSHKLFISNSLQPHVLHARLPCPSLSPRVCSNSSPLRQWCYLTISYSATHFSFLLQPFPAPGSFPQSHLFE